MQCSLQFFSFNLLNNYFPQVGCRCSLPRNYNPFLTEQQGDPRCWPRPHAHHPGRGPWLEGGQCHHLCLCHDKELGMESPEHLAGLGWLSWRLVGKRRSCLAPDWVVTVSTPCSQPRRSTPYRHATHTGAQSLKTHMDTARKRQPRTLSHTHKHANLYDTDPNHKV